MPDSPRGGLRAATTTDAPRDTIAPDADSTRFAHELNTPLAIVMANVQFAVETLQAEEYDPRGELLAALHDALAAAERIRVLVEQRAGAAIATIPASPRPSLAPTSRTRILVVDDELALGRSLQRMLREHEVVVATSGAEALELIAGGERFDVVLCDLMMPDMPGFDLHAQLRIIALDQAERMIFMTGGATTTRAREFVAGTSRVVLQKPLDAQHLREVIRANTSIKGAPAIKSAK